MLRAEVKEEVKQENQQENKGVGPGSWSIWKTSEVVKR